jgi:hypothetical protein
LTIRGSNPAAISGGDESVFRVKNPDTIRVTEYGPRLLMNEEFGH